MEKDFKFKILNGDTTFKEAIMENLMNVFGENIFA
jgi:choline kinase